MITVVCLLTACTTVHLQSAEIADYKDGKPVYELTGFTDPNETTPNSSVKYAEQALVQSCQDGVDVLSVKEEGTHTAFAKYLHWRIRAVCG